VDWGIFRREGRAEAAAAAGARRGGRRERDEWERKGAEAEAECDVWPFLPGDR